MVTLSMTKNNIYKVKSISRDEYNVQMNKWLYRNTNLFDFVWKILFDIKNSIHRLY